MEEKFRNETDITEIRFKIMMLCRKFHNRKLEYGIKFLMCISIIVLVFLANLAKEDKILCLLVAIWGITDILKLDQKRIKEITKLRYSFFANKFKVSNGINSMMLNYIDIEEIIKTRRYYFLQTKDCIFVVDKKGFQLGNCNELAEFILNEVEGKA